MDDKILNIDEIKTDRALKELDNAGLINFKSLENEEIIQINAQPILDLIETIGDIPFPVHLYSDLKKKYRGKKFDNTLSVMLSISCIEFNLKGRELNAMTGGVEAKEDTVHFYSSFISSSYDLASPILNFGNPKYYWFKVKKEFHDKWVNILNNQKPEDFAKYYLK